MPKYSFQRVDPLSQEEVKAMMNQSEDDMKSLIAFLYLYGTRIGEALALRKVDFKVWPRSLTVNILVEKKKASTAPILWKHPLTVKINDGNRFYLEAILARLGMVSEGKIWSMNRRTAWRKIHRINPQCAPHIFRHTRMRRLVEKGADSLALQDWAGWADSRPASNYLGLSGNTAKRFSGKID